MKRFLGVLAVFVSLAGILAAHTVLATPGHQLVTICHKGKTTMQVPVSALNAHLNHGDSLGLCETTGSGK